MGKDADEIRQEIEDTRERMTETADALAYKADVPSRVQDSVGDKVDQLKNAITGSVERAKRAVGDMTTSAGQATDAAQNLGGKIGDTTMNAVDTVRENPLGLFFGAVAIGFVLGSLLPSTQVENERLGPIGDQLKSQAKDQVQGTIEAAKDAAVSSFTTATQS